MRGSWRGAALSPSTPLAERAPSRRHPVAQVQQRREPRGVRRVARQIGDEPVARGQAVPLAVVVQELDLHLRHVDAGRAFALAALARDAQRHRLAHRVGGQRVGAELARQRQAQRVGAAARQMLLVAGRAVGRAHHAGIGFAAGAVVVAHLGGAGEAAPFRPVERGLERQLRVARLEAEQAAVVHLRRPDDLAGVEQARPGRTCP